MALIGTISGSNGQSRTAISGTVIIADRPVSSFPSFPGSGVSFFVSGTTGVGGSSGKVSVFGGDLVVSGTLNSKGAVTASAGVYATGDVLDVSGSFLLTGSAYVTGIVSASALTGSLTKIADGSSYLVAGNNISITTQSNGSVLITGSAPTSPGGSNTQVQFNDNGIFSGSSLFTFNKNTGAVTASYFVGNGGGLTQLTASQLYVSGAAVIDGYLQLLPVGNVAIPTNQTAGYIYVSGNTNDIYFTQYQPGSGFNNTTRLRWLEGMMTTGLLHGGVLSTTNGTTSFNISSGSGIIMSYNASTGSEPYPTVNYVNWPNYTNVSLTYSGSALITYVGINASGGIIQQITPFTLTADGDAIYIGRVLHQSGSVTNGTVTSPIISYGVNHWQDDFTRAIGPLKISGHVLMASGSNLTLKKTAGESYVIGRNYTSDPNNPNLIAAATDTAPTVSKIYREYVSGSSTIQDTGIANAGYTSIDPTLYNNNGTLSSVASGQYTIQRVFWFPNSVNKAFIVYYGNVTYNSLDNAQISIASEEFTEGDNTLGAAILLGYVLVKGNASDLSDVNQARIIQAGISRGSAAGGGGASSPTVPGGLDTYVQFNDGGSTFGGDAGLTYNKTTDTLTIGNISIGDTGLVSTTGTTISLFNSTATTVNFAGAATAINMGTSAGTNIISGVIRAPQGLSGSLTKLDDGTSYIIAGTGISVTSASNGAVTLSTSNIPTSSIVGFPFNDGGSKLATTASIAFSGGQGWNYFANNVGSDVIFYVSGAITNHNTTVTDRKRSIFGGDVVISGSLTQGDLTRADLYAVSMGSGSAALAKYSHAEGEGSSINSAATGSHAEGFYTTTTGSYAHAEGFRTIARGNFSHAEGSGSITATTAQFSHAEGNTTAVSSLYGHAEGELTLVSGRSAHAEGLLTTASNSYSHAEGNQARATGAYAHAEGALTVAFGTHSHAEGNSSTTNANNSHAEGFNCITSTAANYSHAEGYFTTTFGEGSHSEGHTTTTYGDWSHAEGFQSSTTGSYSHVEGRATQTTGSFSHAEGDSTRAIGYASHAEGQSTVASGSYSHAAGIFTVASGSGQSVVGKYNLLNNDFSSFVIGNGVSTAARSDIMRVNTDDVQITGSLVVTTGSVSLPYAAKTTTYNIGSMDYLVDCTSGTFTVTLPTAVGITGRIYIIKNSGAGTITISTTSSQTIDGASPPITLSTQYQVYSVMSNGSNWIKLQ